LHEGTFQRALPQMPVTLSYAERALLSDRSAAPAHVAGGDRPAALEQFMALAQRVGELSAALSLNGDQVALRESLRACQRQLAQLAHVVEVEL
jgi:hypothetical protein